jgi:DNA polymerase-3 subunit delta
MRQSQRSRDADPAVERRSAGERVASPDLSDLKPVYLIYGSEELLLERALERLKERIAAVADPEFNVETFAGESATSDEIINAANTLPFMSDRRLVIVRDVEKLQAASLDAMVAYAKDPAPSTCLVLVAGKIAKNSKLYRAAAASGSVYEYQAPKRSEYGAEVVRLFRDRGKRIDPRAAQALVEVTGRDLRRLDTEAQKLVTYAGERDTVLLDDVHAVASAGASASVFELADAVGARDSAGAIRQLRRLLADGESGVLLQASLVRHVRALVSARALLDRGVSSPQAMAPQLGMPPWRAGNAARQAARFTPAELAEAICGLADSEEQMKTSPAEAGLVLERWIVRTCRTVRATTG